MRQSTEITLRHAGSAESSIVELNLPMLQVSGDLCCDDGTVLAQINTKTHLALRLASQNGAIFTALVNEQELRGKMYEASLTSRYSKPASVVCDMELLVFGPKNIGADVAESLARFKVFLQNPRPDTTTLPYENPQFLRLPGVDSAVDINAETLAIESTEVLGNVESLPNLGEGYINAQTIVDQLPAPEGLRAANIDKRIHTKLRRQVLWKCGVL